MKSAELDGISDYKHTHLHLHLFLLCGTRIQWGNCHHVVGETGVSCNKGLVVTRGWL